MQELRPTNAWEKIPLPQFVVVKVQNTSVSTEAKLQVYMGMEEPDVLELGFFLSPGSSFDTNLGQNSIWVKTTSGATGAYAYADVSNKLIPESWVTEHFTVDVANSYTKMIQRAHTVVIQNISDKDITMAISNETAMQDGFIIKPYQFMGMNLTHNTNINLYANGAKATIFVTPSFDANGGLSDEVLSIYEKYFGLIEIINNDYLSKAKLDDTLATNNETLMTTVNAELNKKVDKSVYEAFLQSNSQNFANKLNKSTPISLGSGLSGSNDFTDETILINLHTADPAVYFDPSSGISLRKITSYQPDDTNTGYLVTLGGLKSYIADIGGEFVSSDGGSLYQPQKSNIIAGTNSKGTLAVSNLNAVTKSGFYTGPNPDPTMSGSIGVYHIEESTTNGNATQTGVDFSTAKILSRTRISGTWSAWVAYSVYVEVEGGDDSPYFLKTGGTVSGATDFINTVNSNVKNYALKARTVPITQGVSHAMLVENETLGGVGIKIESAEDDTVGVSISSTGRAVVGQEISTSGINSKCIAITQSGESSRAIDVSITDAEAIGQVAINGSIADGAVGTLINLDNISTGSTGIKIATKTPTAGSLPGKALDISGASILTGKSVFQAEKYLTNPVSANAAAVFVGSIDSTDGGTVAQLLTDGANHPLISGVENLASYVAERTMSLSVTTTSGAVGYSHVTRSVPNTDTGGGDNSSNITDCIGFKAEVKGSRSIGMEVEVAGAGSVGIKVLSNNSNSIEADGAIVTTDSVVCNGLIAVNNITGFYSDIRLKEEVTSIDTTSALYNICALRPVTYKPSEVALTVGVANKTHKGLIAQEVIDIMPEVVSDAPINRVLKEGDYLTIDYMSLIPELIASVQQLKVENDALRSRIEVLEKKQ